MFVYPSLYEGFGLPPLEAMACGTPVITSNTSSLPEVVGDAGIMTDPYNVDGLANAMHEVLTNDGLSEDMIKKGLKRAKMFSWEKTAKETLKVYEETYNEME
ncbi:Alpha-maltose-1-phosphate synthase [subsurface metagenome]